jgi:hypothetical protein
MVAIWIKNAMPKVMQLIVRDEISIFLLTFKAAAGSN